MQECFILNVFSTILVWVWEVHRALWLSTPLTVRFRAIPGSGHSPAGTLPGLERALYRVCSSLVCVSHMWVLCVCTPCK